MPRRFVWLVLCLGMAALIAACSTDGAIESPVAAPTMQPAADGGSPQPVDAGSQSRTLPTPAVSGSAESGAPAAVALVNGQPIARSAYEMRMAQAQIYFFQQPNLDSETEAGREALGEMRRQVLGWMIDEVLIAQAAAEAGITVTAEQVEAKVQRMRRGDGDRFTRWLTANGLTLDQLRQQIRADLVTAAVRDRVTGSLSREVPQVHVRHILLAEASAAEDVLGALRGEGDFCRLARQYSEDTTTGVRCGDLGFIPRGVMPPAFDEVAFALQPGEASGAVETDSGYYIIQLVEADPARPVPDELWPVVQQRAFADWLAARRAEAQIEVMDASLAP